MEKKHIIIIAVALVAVFAVGAYFTGNAASWWRIGDEYTITGFVIDGVATSSACGSETYEPLYCPRAHQLTYHVDLTPVTYSGRTYCPSKPSITIMERLTPNDWCSSNVVVSRTMAWTGYTSNGDCRYCGTLTIADQTHSANQLIYYDVCKRASGGYVVTNNIAASLYPLDASHQTCSRTNVASVQTATPAIAMPVSGTKTIRSWR